IFMFKINRYQTADKVAGRGNVPNGSLLVSNTSACAAGAPIGAVDPPVSEQKKPIRLLTNLDDSILQGKDR
ncbi:hypothetical protein, partial [Yersinia enterocolitica]